MQHLRSKFPPTLSLSLSLSLDHLSEKISSFSFST
ncbi:unnamed protein product [Spirodela intermedia]|uniref:Uncharacterized protein n=1 Tax=Spirodela intermedia TaxID=51605 RepID=A0A7I8ISD8_SPIIN|nr:unnamed protein product [Spirodela intermedia]CAA6660439.1 unnamed protein product [Spirodela intermedia]